MFSIRWRARGEGPAGVVNQLGLDHFAFDENHPHWFGKFSRARAEAPIEILHGISVLFFHVPNLSMMYARHEVGVLAGRLILEPLRV